MRAPHKNMWELKPEYRHYKEEENSQKTRIGLSFHDYISGIQGKKIMQEYHIGFKSAKTVMTLGPCADFL